MRDNNPPWHYYWWLKLFYIWTLGTMLWSESPVTSAPESQVCVTCVTGDINNLLTMKNHPHQTHQTLANHGKYENNHFLVCSFAGKWALTINILPVNRWFLIWWKLTFEGNCQITDLWTVQQCCRWACLNLDMNWSFMHFEWSVLSEACYF